MQGTSWDNVMDQGHAPPRPAGRVPWLAVIVVAGLGVWVAAGYGLGHFVGLW